MARPRASSALIFIAALSAALVGCEDAVPPLPEDGAWVEAPTPTHTPRPMPKPSFEGAGPDGSLLQHYESRTPRKAEDLEGWLLPHQAKAAIAEMLIIAADDDPVKMRRLLTDNARWGLPDRRELLSQPIISEDDPLGVEFLTAFRNAASRFKERARFNLEPIPGFEMFAASGAEPVWAFYSSDNGYDIISFRLVMERGDLKIDYVGLYREHPEGPQYAPNVGHHAPPLIPYIKYPAPLTLPDDEPEADADAEPEPVGRDAEPDDAEADDEPEDDEADAEPEDAEADAEPEDAEADDEPEPEPDDEPEPEPDDEPEPDEPE